MAPTAPTQDPTPQNLPLTEGQKAVADREALAEEMGERNVAKLRKEQMDAGKVTGDEAQAAKDLQELSETNPAAARSLAQGHFQDSTTVRDGDDALQGHFVRVVDGEHAGRYGVYDTNATIDIDTGRPLTVNVRTRDDDHMLITVAYDALQRAQAGGR